MTFTKVTGRVAFLSTATWDTSTGIGAADTLCKNEAGSAGLAGASSFVAFLATTSASPTSRLTSGSNWIRTDGIAIATSASQFLTGVWSAPIVVAADGVTYPPITNSAPLVAIGGNYGSAGGATTTCKNWTSKAASDTALSGVTSVDSLGLVDGFDTRPCGAYRLYCIQP